MKGKFLSLTLVACLCLIAPGPSFSGGLEGSTYGEPGVPIYEEAGEGGSLKESIGGTGDFFAPRICLNIRKEDLGGSEKAHADGGVRLAGAGKKETVGADEGVSSVISDPLEPLNRVIYHFNDKLYFWVLKPLARGYRAVVPETPRVCIKNFFYNLGFPVRFVNCLFQGKLKGAGDEFTRFMANTTAGFGGLIDVATNNMKIKRYEEDLGQTFGFYGMGPGIFINWPILGPSSFRDMVGWVGDGFLDPLAYAHTKYIVSVRSLETVNSTSLTLGEYEDLKKAALDPYVSLRDAYDQHRKMKIEE